MGKSVRHCFITFKSFLNHSIDRYCSLFYRNYATFSFFLHLIDINQNVEVMKYHIAFFAVVLLVCLTGCEILNADEEAVSYPNALIIKPADPSRIDARLLTEEGTLLYPIESAFGGGGVYPPEWESHRIRFYREKYSKTPDWLEVEPVVAIDDTEYYGIEYTKPGQQIDRIYISGLDYALGLGSSLLIPMKQGKYQGENRLIKEVQIKSYQLPSLANDKAVIEIVIISMAGDSIIIHFANADILNDGNAG